MRRAARLYKNEPTDPDPPQGSVKSFPEPLRRVRLYDAENKVMLVLLINQMELPAEIIAELYRKRWQVADGSHRQENTENPEKFE